MDCGIRSKTKKFMAIYNDSKSALTLANELVKRANQNGNKVRTLVLPNDNNEWFVVKDNITVTVVKLGDPGTWTQNTLCVLTIFQLNLTGPGQSFSLWFWMWSKNYPSSPRKNLPSSKNKIKSFSTLESLPFHFGVL